MGWITTIAMSIAAVALLVTLGAGQQVVRMHASALRLSETAQT
jgi:hypothetical protein